MKKCCFLFLSCLLLFTTQINSQTKAVSDAAFAEKIYLQVTSTVLTTDDALWFKCLVTDANQVPTTLSNILHIELIDFDERILETKLFKIEEGVVSGFIDLNEKMASGRYQLRAYTEWNKNFGEEFISKVYVDVYQPKEIKKEELAIREVVLKETEIGQLELSAKAYPRLLNSKHKGKLQLYIHTESQIDTIEVKKGEDYEYSFQYLLPKNSVKARIEVQVDSIKLRNHHKGYVPTYSKRIVVDKDYLDVQFFAEGGKMIADLQNKLAFKVLDYQNKGIEIQGKIVNESDEVITSFSSNALGMGVFDFTPKQGEKYHTEIKGMDGVIYKYPLPKVESKGIVVCIEESKNKIVLKANSNLENQKNVLVKIQSHGMSQGVFFMEFENNQAKRELDKSKFREGILKFSVYNLKGHIVSERLFFNYKEEERINLETELNKQSYEQREKTKLSLFVKDKEGNPIICNVSALVINKELLEDSYQEQNSILSYFLLNSELKGTIENPVFYFDKNNSERKQDMDALLLTQGWRNYTYDAPLETGKFEFLPEKNLTVSGTIRDILTKKVKKPLELTLMYEPLQVETQYSKANGRFKFNLKDQFKEKFKVAIQSKDKKGKKKEIKVELDSYQSPDINYETDEKIYMPDSIYQQVIEQSIQVQEAEEAYSLANGAELLDEVELTGYVMTPQRQKVMDLHGAPDVVIENEELITKEESWHYGLYSVLQSAYPDDIEVLFFPPAHDIFLLKDKLYSALKSEISKPDGFMVARDYNTDFTFILVDGVLVKNYNYPNLGNIPIEELKSVELIKTPKNSRDYFFEIFIKKIDPQLIIGARSSIISIYTYTGKGMNYLRKNYGMEKLTIQGFTPQSTEFYSQKYDNEVLNNWEVPDLRSVVHWNPVIKTDENGEAVIDFYNGDNTGEMMVIVEGFTKDGRLGYSSIIYDVKAK